MLQKGRRTGITYPLSESNQEKNLRERMGIPVPFLPNGMF